MTSKNWPTTPSKTVDFGWLLRELRETRRLSQADAAKKLGYDASLIGKVERGERIVTPDYLAALIQAYDLDFEQSEIVIDRWLVERGLGPRRQQTYREMYGID